MTSSLPPDAASVESEHVHSVYDTIAEHFSQTRYKPWPIIENFLNQSIAISAKPLLVADIGCGNGKYMSPSPRLFFQGCDHSLSLCQLAVQLRPHAECHAGDGLHLSFRDRVFDIVLSVAVVHHWASWDRRRDAVRELMRICSAGGRILIYVWAWEQGASRLRTKQAVRPVYEEETLEQAQDVFVPWTTNGKTLERFYHLFKEGEVERLTEEAALLDQRQIVVEQAGYDKDNWYIIVRMEN